MITNIAVTGVFVSDQEKALDFYTNKLGFEKRADEPMGDGQHWLEVAPPGAATRIVLTQATAEWGADRLGQFAGIVFEPDDIDATYRELSARGVAFSGAPADQPWGGRQAQFQDQDGNTFVIVQR
jgi:catechol 2,3-dioxygenase-like lactoylglutathione lyase family enzyme